MSKRVHVAHYIGEVVFLKTDPEQAARIVTRLTISQGGTEYMLRSGAADATWHSAVEIQRERSKSSIGYK
jgi:hypothetical protein